MSESRSAAATRRAYAQKKAKEREQQNKAAQSALLTASIPRQSGILNPLDLVRRDAATGMTAQDRVDIARTFGAPKGTRQAEESKKKEEEKTKTLSQQQISSHDKLNLSDGSQRLIQAQKLAYDQAKAKGDAQGMREAHAAAEAIRRRAGYSGGADGSEYLSPELTTREKATLNDAGERLLKAAKLDYNAARKSGDVKGMQSAQAKMNQLLQAKGYQPRADRTTGHGMSVDAGPTTTAGEFARRLDAGAKAATAGAMGSPLALAETAAQATNNRVLETNRAEVNRLANDLNLWKDRLKLVRQGEGLPEWGSESYIQNRIKIAENAEKMRSAATTVDPNLPGQSAMRLARQWQQEATEGMTGVERFLANTAISGGQMLPGIAASFIPVAGPAIGTGILGAQAAGQKAYDLTERGISPAEALQRGVTSGLIEGATERIGIGHLVRMVNRAGGASFLKNIAQQMGIEATEESVAYALNAAADKAYKDPEAKFSLQELAESAAAGAILGGTFGGAGTVINRAMNRPAQTPQRPQSSGQEALLRASGFYDRQAERAAEEAQEAQEQTMKNAPTEAVRADTTLFDRSVLQNLNQARTNFMAFAREYFPQSVKNKETGSIIKISRNGIDKFLSGRLPYEKYATGFHIPELIERAHKVGEAKDAKNREHITGYEYYDSPITVDGTAYTAHIRVRNTKSGDSYYGHTISEIDSIEIEPSARVESQRETEPVYAVDGSTSQKNPQDTEYYNADASADPAHNVQNVPPQGSFIGRVSPERYAAKNGFTQAEDTLPNAEYPTRTSAEGTPAVQPENTGYSTSEPVEQPSDRLTENPQDTVAAPGNDGEIMPIKTGTLSGDPSDTISSSGLSVPPQAETVNDELPEGTGAASAGFDPYTQALNRYGAIEPGENPARMVDVPRSTDGTDRVRRGARTFMEAEVTTDQTVEGMEQAIMNKGFSYKPKKDKDSLKRAVKTLEESGIDPALEQWQQVVDGRRACTKDDIVLAEILYINAERTGDTQLAQRLAAEIAAEGTRAGQNVQALRLLKQATKEGRMYYIRKTVQYMKEDLKGRMGGRAENITLDDRLVQNYMNAQGNQAEADALDAIYESVADQIPPTWGDRITAWRYFAMLGNPKTHLKNVIGNLIFGKTMKTSSAVSALIQSARLSKEDRTRAVFSSQEAKDFAKQDWAEMKPVLSGSKYDSAASDIQRKVQERSLGVFNAPAKFSSRAMTAEDTMAKKSMYISSMASFLTAKGWDLNNLTADQLEQARTHAIKDAKKSTFQDASDLATMLSRIERKGPAYNVAVGGIMPFKGVPINIAKEGFKLSPAGLLKSLTYDLAQVKRGNIEATEAIDNISQGLTGTSIAAIGAFLAAQGVILGAGSDDEKEQALLEAHGDQTYALDLSAFPVNFLGREIGPANVDYTYTLDWAAPAALPLFIGAEVYNAFAGDIENGKALEKAFNAILKMYEPMLNMTVLSGVSDTIRTAGYSQNDPISSLALGTAESFAGQFVPTILGQIARTYDDTRRTTFGDKSQPFPDLQRFIQQQENKIPGLSQDNVPYLNAWGETDTTRNVLLRALENFVSPGYLAKKEDSALKDELLRLNDEGYEGMFPTSVEKSAKLDDKYITADQYVSMQTTRGQTAKKILDSFLSTDAYRGMTDGEKAKFVEKVYDYAAEKGKEAGGGSAEDFASWITAASDAQKAVGLSEEDFISLYAYKSVLNEEAGDETKNFVKQGMFETYIDGLSRLNEDQKKYVKDNVKFWDMFPADSGQYNRAVAAGYTDPKEIQALFENRKNYDMDGDGDTSSKAEIYNYITSATDDIQEQEKMWNALKEKGEDQTLSELKADYAPKAQAIKSAKASLDEAVPGETQTAFATAISNSGADSQADVKKALLSVDATDAERVAYYNLVKAKRGWKKTWYQVKTQ